jgi:hypothetical protein
MGKRRQLPCKTAGCRTRRAPWPLSIWQVISGRAHACPASIRRMALTDIAPPPSRTLNQSEALPKAYLAEGETRLDRGHVVEPRELVLEEAFIEQIRAQ